MKIDYRGHTLEAYREKSLSGAELIFYSIFRNKDKYEVDSGYSYDGGSVRSFLKSLKKQLDEELDGPPEED